MHGPVPTGGETELAGAASATAAASACAAACCSMTARRRSATVAPAAAPRRLPCDTPILRPFSSPTAVPRLRPRWDAFAGRYSSTAAAHGSGTAAFRAKEQRGPKSEGPAWRSGGPVTASPVLRSRTWTAGTRAPRQRVNLRTRSGTARTLCDRRSPQYRRQRGVDIG